MVIPNEGKLIWLDWALTGNGSSYENFDIELYVNDDTLGPDTTLADFTIATFPGYSTVTLTRDDFSDPVIVSDEAQSTGTPTPSYTCTGGGGQLVYGWLMVGATSGKVLACQAFAAARNMTAGATETLDPFTFTLDELT